MDDLDKIRNILVNDGHCEFACLVSLIRYKLFVPFVAIDLSATFSNALLADATHQLHCNGYIFIACIDSG